VFAPKSCLAENLQSRDTGFIVAQGFGMSEFPQKVRQRWVLSETELTKQNWGQIKFQDTLAPATQLQIRKFALTPLLRFPGDYTPNRATTAGLEKLGLQNISRNTPLRPYRTQALPAPSSNFFIPNTLNPRCTDRTVR
jgi:hypothetical protein